MLPKFRMKNGKWVEYYPRDWILIAYGTACFAIIAIGLASIGWISLAQAEDASSDRSWHLLTQSEGGTVSLLKDLTQHECEYAMHRAKGEPATAEEVREKEAQRKAADAAARKYCANLKPGDPLYASSGIGCAPDGSVVSWGFSSSHYVEPGDIASAECFQ